MSKYQNLLKYISYFENATENEACRWSSGGENEEGVITMSYPIYDEQLTTFIDEVYKTNLLDSDYFGTLKKHGLSSEELISEIDDADIGLTKAILTYYVRQERFCDGLWASAVKDKVFYKILIRLRELED
ncbi:DUF6508 domain-containing protein [Alkalihalobacillus sp. AL-G]|uniref:DUF6508 domain-containing protein n=1 Tax=Alkalihalobacillus sp. AL-G TaxID=2926399 RepID=UPI00272B4C91|nr:DUF6508 domain-containing protein [Alkalihalobacillus sp. AL-G]WLD93807.1 DUF6508 domain-containing protein [Alkalihalobacillus sp. AL-G]